MNDDSSHERARDRPPTAAQEHQDQHLGDTDVRQAFGESLEEMLDLDKWATALDWEGATKRFRDEIPLR